MTFFNNINEIHDRLRQFGLLATSKQLFKVVARSFYRQDNNIIAIRLKNQSNNVKTNNEVKPLSLGIIKKLPPVSQKIKHQLETPLFAGCAGFYIERDQQIAGCAFTQSAGLYNFGFNGQFQVPPNVTILKNLFVFRDFRGQGLADEFNHARLASIPQGHIPIVFVIPENRFALRSLKKHGFIKAIQVKRTTWFKRFTKQEITVLLTTKYNNLLSSGLSPSEHSKP